MMEEDERIAIDKCEQALVLLVSMKKLFTNDAFVFDGAKRLSENSRDFNCNSLKRS